MRDSALVVNVDVAVARGDDYLFIERAESEAHAAGSLAFPGGKVEDPPADDPIEATAVREVREEVGVAVEDITYVLSSAFVADDGTECLNVVTLGTYAGGDARPREPEEVAAVHWLTPAELRARNPPEFLLGYLERVETQRG